MGRWAGSLPLTWAGSPSRARQRCARGMRRAPRRGKVGLEEVGEAGKKVEEGLLDEVEGGCRGPTAVLPWAGHRSRASVSTPFSRPEGGDR